LSKEAKGILFSKIWETPSKNYCNMSLDLKSLKIVKVLNLSEANRKEEKNILHIEEMFKDLMPNSQSKVL